MTREGWRVRLVFAGKALVMTSLLAAAALLVVRAQRHRADRGRHLVDLANWNVIERPAWSEQGDVVAVRDASGLVGRALPLYDRSAAELVRAALEDTPRVLRVISTRRIPPDTIEVALEMRRPVAAVVVAGGAWVEVDAEGVVLGPPTVQRPVRSGVALRVVTGGAQRTPAPGRRCAPDVRAGVRLCRLLDAYRDGLGAHVLRTFDEVDVANHGGRVAPAASALLLRASPPSAGVARPTPCVVEWGRLGTSHGEPPFEDKAARLERAISVFDDFEGVARVRVAFDTLTVLPIDGPAGDWLPALANQTFGR